ncbi:MAG: hypothetical protein IAE78_17095 [Myxococcus sp.]|nr:hypothetical protein [Myxococcus sp.]
MINYSTVPAYTSQFHIVSSLEINPSGDHTHPVVSTSALPEELSLAAVQEHLTGGDRRGSGDGGDAPSLAGRRSAARAFVKIRRARVVCGA